MKKTLIALTVLSFAGACGREAPKQEASGLDALYAESSISSLQFATEGGRIYLAEGQKVLPWAHSAPTAAGNDIVFQGKVIGNLQTGYFCNGPFDSVCDASIYKSRPSSISIKATNAAGSKPLDPNKVRYISANTQQLSQLRVSTPVAGKAKGTCTVATSGGAKTMPLTVEQKKALNQAGQEVKMLEIKTPVYRYRSDNKQLEFVRMKTLQRVFSNGAVQNVEASPASTSVEVQGLLRLFN